MELLIKCVSVAVFSVLVILLLRRWNPELSFAVSAVSVLVLLLSFGTVIEELIRSLREVQQMFRSSAIHARPMLKCLGIAFISKFGADLCRDASQSALASVVETAGTLCAAALAMPLMISLMTMIGGML